MAGLLPAALAGDAESQFLVGRLYEDGIGVPIDLAEAIAWWAMAAVQGHAPAAAAIEAAGPRLDPAQLERATRLWAVHVQPATLPPAPARVVQIATP